MEVIFPAPRFLLWIIIGIFVITVPAVFLKKGGLPIKIGVMILITISCGLLLFFFYRDTKLAVNEQGLYSDNYGKFTIKWEEIDKAFVIEDLKESEYKPVLKTNGYAMGEVGFGWFALKNGKSARAVLQTRLQCLVVVVDDKTYLFGPKDFDEFIRIIRQYISLTTDEEI